MTPDIRTAAQREAEATWPKYPSGEAACEIDTDRHLKRKSFRKGAVWGAARVTPTREALAMTVAQFFGPDDTPEDVADAVLALIQELAEGTDV